MRAIGFKQSLPISDPESFIAFDTPVPLPKDRELLIKITAISFNPVDFKIRQSAAKETILDEPKIIGWDATGVVVDIGSDVSLFKAGDEVYYAGEITRPGCNAEFQIVDERIVGLKPKSLTDVQAAALPLTAITAWEMIFDRIRISPEKDKGKSVLIIGGAGGMGSIAIQLARQIAGLKVITTASRPESVEWCQHLGADVVVDHKDLISNLKAQDITEVDYILDLIDANGYWDSMVQLIKPQGHIASITGNSTPVQLNKLKTKSASFSWEYMYTRSFFQTEDMIEQHHILNRIAGLVDKGVISTTVNKTLKGFTVENLKTAHQLLESGKTIGKIVVEY
ncbi:zinc-binding alcohol dehydrogenase family protein [Chitinophaga sp. RAB17]|uniref:zinc-binding alcohol dehydrogenase family protein n=1 Tax=Chitinophaga sp. RAB17 TaxID=3233049 RepID=UPI003F8E6B19